jgi:hypothetical protein
MLLYKLHVLLAPVVACSPGFVAHRAAAVGRVLLQEFGWSQLPHQPLQGHNH